jgi:hypothetical protein
MRIESGPALVDRIYWSIFALVCFLLAGYFFYDGEWGYLKDNRADAARALPPQFDVSFDEIELGHSPTEPDIKALRARQQLKAEDVHAALGQPVHTKREGAGQTVEYFASLYGYVTVTVRDGRVTANGISEWKPWSHSKEETDNQIRLWMPPALLIGLYAAFRAYRANTLRVVIDDEGVSYAKTRIPFDAMTSLRDYNRKGWVDLYYRVAAGQKRLRIDNQKVAKFDEIVEAICQARGFENPVAAYQQKLEQEQAKRDQGAAPAAGDEPTAAEADEAEDGQSDQQA